MTIVEELNQEYGEIIAVKFLSYYKYCFRLEIQTTKGIYEMRTGGDRDDIYRYDPLDLDWGEHYCGARVQEIKEIKTFIT
ncbi:MAG: hypothetical protein EOO46_10435 [Flavobacterium sp.]|nr:MAG: hypothetical protein EOO46_10435 [Flavobacterium sp.]